MMELETSAWSQGRTLVFCFSLLRNELVPLTLYMLIKYCILSNTLSPWVVVLILKQGLT